MAQTSLRPGTGAHRRLLPAQHGNLPKKLVKYFDDCFMVGVNKS